MDVIYAGRLTTEGWAAEEREGGGQDGVANRRNNAILSRCWFPLRMTGKTPKVGVKAYRAENVQWSDEACDEREK